LFAINESKQTKTVAGSYGHDKDDTAMMNEKLNRHVYTANVGHLNITIPILSNVKTGVDIRIKLMPKCPGRPVFYTRPFIVFLA
jgi:hypothetical protein